ncbi:MAG: trimeric intracellular cation channel family protein [Clostridia bacterium]|nr:trimeric intracellular cation channel family protein [Clostridia bacterium]
MNVTEISLLVLEILGTIAFTISGAFCAIKAKLDLFGVVFIGTITAVGGGIVRDILIGSTPPRIFDNYPILIIAFATALIAFLVACILRKKFNGISLVVDKINNVFDAIGLGAFSVIGTEIAFAEGVSANPLLAILLGVLTGVGGGVFRDILTASTPYIFKKHVYAIASLVGATAYYVIRLYFSEIWLPSLIGMLLVIIIRLLATRYHWSLPKAHLEMEYEPLFHVKKKGE